MKEKIVITGVGLTSPLGNSLEDLRAGLLENKSGLQFTEVRHMGKVVAGLCDFEETKYQSKKMRKRGTRAGAISIFCTNEAINDSQVDWEAMNKDRVGVYFGITEHGNVETENEIHDLYNKNNLDINYWSHHHNPRTVANNPAGEVTLNLKITGPHYTIGGACAAGNLGIIQGLQMLQLGEIDFALCGGISECPQTFGIFAAFNSQGALGFNEDPGLACRPLDKNRNGISVSEGGCVYTLERESDALKRGAKIYAEIISYHTNSDAKDFVLPQTNGQISCMTQALEKANLSPSDIDIVNLHATGTKAGDIAEIEAVQSIFRNAPDTSINCTKGHLGHTMGAAGSLELAGNLPSFNDNKVHPCHGIEELDENCNLPAIVTKEAINKDVSLILNNSFGMLGINSVLIVKKHIK
jgi:3-oxoacyl-[acyl-carrier-protein] synthase II